ncbi:inhibitor of nuclear factor kappa-B kinase subunit beta [Pectinophora gossypiella]|uniref:inhibitor of nuclear factor kappa-B kinase subunit beta n=1 Tax=Pectinophora gossypiella TaxID=13191 RepID=UPI00214E84D2|nr:inhibitor of nuclear factor kappa-B kinase subunit beta [Pectinophora gossypiella]
MDDIVFIGDWIKDRVLGSGSFGTVVLWKHKNTDERLAIKTCKWGDELTAKHKERWSKEVEMLQNCNNPNIVGTRELPAEFEAGLAPANPSRLPILCMEYCSGGDLRQLLNKPDCSAGLQEPQVRQILSDVCNAMQFLHMHKITHRDLKPENIVLHVDNAPPLPTHTPRKVIYKLIDLGYAKEIDSNSVCASFVGTLQYLAPEILYSKTYSNSVDYWSLGLLAFEIICGTRPFLPFMAPVQWMPFVKKKAHDNICVYETFHGDIEYSNEIFPENHISKAFKVLIEKWLRVALEWEPKLRGRDTPSKVTFNIPAGDKGSPSNVIIFNLLQNILSTKVIKVFSVHTLSKHSYEIDDKTTIAELKLWLSRDTAIPVPEQILLSQATYSYINNDDLAAKYWNDSCNTMLYLYNNSQFFKDHLEPVVPKAVQRCLEHPKALYNFKNSQTLYKNALYFVMSQMEIYDSLIQGLFTRGEALKHESKNLMLQHNVVDKKIGKLVAQEEVVSKMTEIGKKHIQNIKDSGVGTNYLGGFEKIFNDTYDLSEKLTKLQTAWNQLSVRLQSAARRSTEGLSADLNNFIAKYNYHTLLTNAMKVYVTYKKSELYNEHKTKEKQCHDIMKVCYECLKLRSKIISELKNQPFLLKLLDLSTEFAKISEIVTNAADNTEKLSKDLLAVTDEMNNCTWSTLSILASDADNLAELPYSVVSFQKRDFKIGETVSNHCINVANKAGNDDQLRSLIEESLKLRQSHMSLSAKLNSQKQLMTKSTFDFSFLNEK